VVLDRGHRASDTVKGDPPSSSWVLLVVWMYGMMIKTTATTTTTTEPLSFINEEQPEVGKAIAATLLVFILNELLHHRVYRGRVPGSKTRPRIRGNIRSIFDEYGPFLFRRAFRMHEVSFWKLLDLIEANMGSKGSGKRKRGATPNGTVPNSVRLAVALRYFAGGDPLDIALV
jgi:hypothetical protein